jgi:hypothetical protein
MGALSPFATSQFVTRHSPESKTPAILPGVDELAVPIKQTLLAVLLDAGRTQASEAVLVD